MPPSNTYGTLPIGKQTFSTMAEAGVPEGNTLSTIFDPSTCTRKGLCPVTVFRKQGENPLESHSLYFEQHGFGPEKIVFIMGCVLIQCYVTKNAETVW